MSEGIRYRMHGPVMNQAALMGEVVGGFDGRDFEDGSEVERRGGGGEGSGGELGEGAVSSRGRGGAIRDRPVEVIPCPRCQSMNTKFCYYNNYSVNQLRHFCRNCQRYWTVGGTLRNVPVGGGSRKKTRPRSRNDAYLVRGARLESPPASNSGDMTGLLHASSCLQQLSMLPPSLGGMGFSPFPSSASQLPFLSGFEASSLMPQILPKSPPISGLQEVPDLQSFYDLPQALQVPQLHLANSAPMMLPNQRFFLPDLQSAGAHNDAPASVMAKTGLWSSPVQHLQALTGGLMPATGAWDERPLVEKANSLTPQQLSYLSGYEPEALRADPIGSTPMNSKLAPPEAGMWDMHSDRLVPHVNAYSWEDGLNSSTTEVERYPPKHCFGYQEDVVSQPWVGMPASNIVQF